MGGKSATGPQVTSLSGIQVNTSVLGGAVPLVYGTTRVSDNMIWYANFQAYPQKSSGGGKGGGGSVTTGYTYTASIINAICEGPIVKIGQVWQGKTIETLSGAGLTLFNGTYPQSPWGYVTSNFSSQALNYAGIAYVCAANYTMDGSGSMPNMNYEVYGKNINFNGYDANPKDIIIDVLTNQYSGAGISSSFIGDLTNYSNYCIANGLLLSVYLNSQTSITNILDNIMQETNSEMVYSEGVIKIIPYGDTAITANGATFTPNITPIYDLTDDDFINRESPVQVTRTSPADAYNQFQIEYLDRSNYYNTAIAMHDDLANIDLFGLKPNQPIQMHEICSSDVANKIVQLICNRTLYVRNTYQFDVSWKYILLEPMDIITITDSGLGLNKFPVRITEITESKDGKLTITADEYPFGTLNATLYPNQTASGYMPSYTASAGNTNAPMLLEPPDTLSNGLEIWIGASGGNLWAGCDVYLSYDNVSYAFMGTISTPTAQGLLTSDIGSSIGINTFMSGATLSSGSSADFLNFANLLYIDNELLNFQNATLTSANMYTLSPLQRGLYNSINATHTVGSLISKVDSNAVLKVPFTTDQIGQTIYIKIPSFNIFGAAKQSLADVTPYTYKIKGTDYQSPLPDITNVNSFYKNTSIYITWDVVTDFRAPIDYEVRVGTSWDSGQILGRYSQNTVLPQNDGLYWIKAHYLFPTTNTDIYSTNAQSIEIAGQLPPKNVIVTYDEDATGWSGTCSGYAAIIAGTVQLTSTNQTGYYEVPTSHIIDIGTAQICNVSCAFSAQGFNPSDFVSTWTLVSAQSSISGVINGGYQVKAQINIAQNDGIFTGWRDFVPSDFVGRIFKMRLVLVSENSFTNIQVSAFTWSVDVPDRVDTGNSVSVATDGTAVTFTRPFHGVPNTQITIIGATAGDDIVLTSQTVNGFTVQVVNGGVGVARIVNWLSAGY